MALLGIFQRIYIQRFILSSECIWNILRHPAMLRPALTEAESQPRMKQTEYSLKKWLTEPPAHQLIPLVPGAQAIPMAKTEILPSYINIIWLLEYLHSQFFEIPVAPDVVIALEEINLHASIHKIHQGRENSHIALRNNVPVLDLTNLRSLSSGSFTSKPRCTSETKYVSVRSAI